MPSLKDLRNRIKSVKSTRKITSAMKMVAASKLRRAQEQAEAGKPYALRMARLLSQLAAGAAGQAGASRLLAGTGKDQVHLLVVVTADKGLAGGFNSQIGREVRRRALALEAEGKTVKIFAAGRKGRDYFRSALPGRTVESVIDIGRPKLGFNDARAIADRLLSMYDDGAFDVATLVFNEFISVINQKPKFVQLIPFAAPEAPAGEASGTGATRYEFEPSEEEILAEILPRNIAVQVYRGLLESAAGEHAARMTAMDSATRNAGDMINRLQLVYNRTRQAYITKELIEIISGAEAV